MLRFSLTAVLSLCLFPALSSAQEGQGAGERIRMAVLNVESEDNDVRLAEQITAIIKREAKGNPSFEMVQQGDISLFDSLMLFGCEETSADCLAQLATSIDTDRIIYGELKKKGELYDISIKVFDLEEAKDVRRWHKRFTADVDTVGFFSKEMSYFIGGRKQVVPGLLKIDSNVRGAEVRVDGKLVGTTPFRTESLPPAQYSLEVRREGYKPWTTTVKVTSAEKRIFEVMLEPMPSENQPEVAQSIDVPPPVELKSSHKVSTYSWVVLSLGALTFAGGGVMGMLSQQTQMDFEETSIEADAHALRDKGQSQADAANSLFAVGSAVVLAGAILLLVHAFDDELDEEPAFSSDGGGAVIWRY